MSGDETTSSSSGSMDEEVRSQRLLQNPSLEICKFTDPEIDQISSLSPAGTIFRPFDSSLLSDSFSKDWVCFLACPFLIGYSYPFPQFTQSFFTSTGLSYIQAIPMIWRALLTLEELRDERGLDFGLPELSSIYSLVSHGFSRFLLKSKPHQPTPLYKVTQNGSAWKNRFFFVKRSSIPCESVLPIKWVKKVENFVKLSEAVGTEERVKAFMELDPIDRTFKIKNLAIDSRVSDLQSSSHSKISSMHKSSGKSAVKFSLEDIDDIISPKVIKKEATKSAAASGSHVVLTRAKAGTTKKRKVSESGNIHEAEKQLQDMISETLQNLHSHYESVIKDLEESLTGMRIAAAAKDKAMTKLIKEKKQAKHQVHAAEAKMQEGIKAATEETKMWAAKLIVEARLKMVEEASDPSFDKTQWDMAGWKRSLSKFGDVEEEAVEEAVEGSKDAEVEGEKMAEAGTSEAKDAAELEAVIEGAVKMGNEGYEDKA